MKKHLLITLILILSLLLSGCGITRAYMSGDTMLTPYGAFWHEGRQIGLYSDRSSTRITRTVLTDVSEQVHIGTLDSGNAVYDEKSERLWYTEKHKLMSCLPDCSDEKLEKRVRTKVKRDRMSIAYAEDGLLIIKISYGSIEGIGKNLVFKLSFPSESYMLYDTASGELTQLIAEEGSGIAPAFLSIEDGTIWFLQLDPASQTYGLYSMKTDGTGRTLLSELGTDLDIASATGASAGRNLYFCCGGLWRWNETSGLTSCSPALENGGSAQDPMILRSSSDDLYVLFRGPGEVYDAYLYRWIPEEDRAEPASPENYAMASGMSFAGGDLSIWRPSEILEAKTAD
ncbi:MAG: hypothetical protein II499_09270 [Firmicutes bacterium]|nr:hypothetical protein [Bacillota bacterium]